MKLITETKRLILREFDLSDAINFYELNLDEEVIKYTGDVAFASVEESKDLIRNYDQYKKNGFGRWAVIFKETNEILGWCGLKYIDEIQQTDLGFRLHKRFWNKGYATEASTACLHLGFEHYNLQQIVGQVHRDNVASKRVLEKVGMIYWRELYNNDNTWLVYGINKHDFLTR